MIVPLVLSNYQGIMIVIIQQAFTSQLILSRLCDVEEQLVPLLYASNVTLKK